MKKLLILFAVCTFAMTNAYSQDDTYYTDDESTVTVKSQEAPPALPDYVQPPCPGDGYLWTPGYWAWGAGGYYWVPGVWVMPPTVGFLWTPGYWGFYHGYYGWHAGYWGPHIGYYGGVCYGFGYYGSGFYGGRWEGGHFMYNSAVWHVGGGIHNVYADRSVVRNVTVHASFNGPGGVRYRPSGAEMGAIHENHTAMTKEHAEHERSMGAEKEQFHSASHSAPAVHSMSTPGGQRFNQAGHSMGGGAPRGGGGGHAGGGGGHMGGGGRH